MTESIVKDYLYSYSPRNETIGTVAKIAAEVRREIAPFRFSLAARGIVKELSISLESNVLELGCGLGLLGEAIKKQTGSSLQYLGLDLVFNSAKESNNKGILSIQAETTHLPLPNESFDFIVTTDVLEHVPDAKMAINEIFRVLRPGGKAFIVIADPSEARFDYVTDHINRSSEASNVASWEKLLVENGLNILPVSAKYRRKDWRRIFNLPLFAKLKNKPGFACAFNPINRPGVYIVQKPNQKRAENY